jgi:hypothetical protein
MICIQHTLKTVELVPELRFSLMSLTDENNFVLDLDMSGLTVWGKHVGPVKNMSP